MSTLRLDRLLEFLTSIELAVAILWLGLTVFTAGIAVLMYTRWGQYKPLRKCMAMSLLAHLLLAGYAATIEIVTPTPQPAEQILHVTLGDGPDQSAPPGGAGPERANAADQPWEVFPADAVAQPEDAELERGTADPPVEPKRLVRADDAKLPGAAAVGHLASAGVALAKPVPPPESAESIEAPAARRRDAATPSVPGAGVPLAEPAPLPAHLADDSSQAPVRTSSSDLPAALLEQIVPLPQMGESAGAAIAGVTGGPRGRGGGAGKPAVPDAYRLRVAPDRADVAQSHGGTADTEAAVKAALKWLADNQTADGRWDPRLHEAGKEANLMSRNRQNAGSRADTGMTGLALLSFLGSGHTHLEGPYRQDVSRGLEFLMRTQAADGNLGGHAVAFEFMYCHAMAACAISEAYGMTRDPRLREPVRRAVGYTIAAQDPKGGGWRYKPGDPGDTSQLGWQLMAMKSAELAGIPMPDRTRQGIVRYLQSVSSGRHGGRASYRPGEQSTRPMTAEALVCWQFIGLDREHPACNEAGDYLLGELPGEGTYNLYYWYYATLGMYQLQDEHWQRWNDALRVALVSRQVKEGPLAGSWDTNDLWGGHGGRVYTTALATLTLEVYYRFLPLYAGVYREEYPASPHFSPHGTNR